jgi:hypothetical protein
MQMETFMCSNSDFSDRSLDSIEIEEIDLSAWEGKGRFAVVLHNLFTPQECLELIARSESSGYEDALVNIGGGRQMKMPDVRNNDRCMIDDPVFANNWWQRIVSCFPDPRLMMHESFKKGDQTSKAKASNIFFAFGLNERLRFLRYDPGSYFAPHYDGRFVRVDGPLAGELSYVTCQLYLNEGFEGGSTKFQDPNDSTRFHDVVPRTGSVLLFEHGLFHSGDLVVAGRKYAIRTDVMYSRKTQPQ